MRAEPIKTGFFTLGNGAIRPDTPKGQRGQGAENPRRYWFFTLGSMGKNSFAASGIGGLGTHSPFRGVCRNCHNPRRYWTEGGGVRKARRADSQEMAAPGADRMPIAPGLYPDGPAQGRGACGASGGKPGGVRGRVPPPARYSQSIGGAVPCSLKCWTYTLRLFVNINPERISHALH